MKRLKTTIALGAALSVAALLGGQNAAFANTYIQTPPSEFDLYDTPGIGIVADWYSFYDPAVNLYGWTGDAFDGWGVVTLDDGEAGTWTMSQAVPDSLTTAADGTTTIIFTDNTENTLAFSSPYNVTATITLQGSFARWSVDVARQDAAPVDEGLMVNISGNLGSDFWSTFSQTGSSMVMVSNDGERYDPVLSWQASNTGGTFDGWDHTEGDDIITAAATGASNLTAIVAMVEWDPCSFDAALAYAESIKSVLVDNFGSALAPFYGCMTVDPLTLVAGTPTTATLTYVIWQRVTDPDGKHGYFGYNDPSFVLEPVAVDIQGLPAGVTYSQSQDPATGLVTVQLAGSPTEGGTFSPRVVFAHPHSDTPAVGIAGFDPALVSYYDEPLVATMSMTVTLANTGANAAQNTLLLTAGGGVLLAGAATLVVLGIRRRNGAKRTQ